MSDSHKARFTGHLSHSTTCACGRVFSGNGRTAHQRTCEPYLEANGYPLADDVVAGIRADLDADRHAIDNPGGLGRRPVYASDVLPGIRRRLGDVVLERRRAGDQRAPLPWSEMRPLLATAYDEALAELLAAHNGARR